MGLNKVMKQLCVTAALVVLSTVTAFAANVGQASGTNVNVRAGASTGANVLGKINKGTEYPGLRFPITVQQAMFSQIISP